MSITPSDVIDQVADRLLDPNNSTWTEANLIEYFNDGLYECMKVRPNSANTTKTFALVAGVVQTIPTADYMLMDVIRNMGIGGTTPGRIITSTDRWQIDMVNQHWHQPSGKSYTENYSYEPNKSLTTFYVSPPVKSGSEHSIQATVATPHTAVFRTTLGVVTTDFATDDKIDLTAHGLVTGDRVAFTNVGGALPGGLVVLTDYFVINETANDFEVSLTSGGSAVNITSDGTGTHSVNQTNKYTTVARDEGFIPAVKAWMLRNAYSKETSVASADRARQWEASFYQMLGMKIQVMETASDQRKAGE